jgi:hypothetical protein
VIASGRFANALLPWFVALASSASVAPTGSVFGVVPIVPTRPNPVTLLESTF